MTKLNNILEQLNDHPGFIVSHTSKNLIISYPGYKHMNLFKADEAIRSCGVKYDYSKEHGVFDQISGRSSIYYIIKK
jgi:hypothetical protein